MEATGPCDLDFYPGDLNFLKAIELITGNIHTKLEKDTTKHFRDTVKVLCQTDGQTRPTDRTNGETDQKQYTPDLLMLVCIVHKIRHVLLQFSYH